MVSSTLKALLVAFATLSSAAPLANETLNARELVLMGGADCCTWEGCAHCEYGPCVLTKSTAEGTCPFKSGTLPAPIPAGEKCCMGAGCQPCHWGLCVLTAVLIGHEGYCPWPDSNSDSGILDPGAACLIGDKCRFGECARLPGKPGGRCPSEGDLKPFLGQGESCCVRASCAPCAPPYYCEMLARPNVHNYPPGTCMFN
ncbi:hypothetical protein ESCO_003258 [Escovopsis weberi]|uniref:Uncharacterized protein n=1 Tax=Escovopsis weberi TaxID=150374 RepID=A0A0M8N0K1_ESCWE|nr:hypothetical protein ESCO_003258 [Escovopsis weberi]